MSQLLWQKPGVKVDARIQRFLAGEDVILPAEPELAGESGKVVDLMAALQESVRRNRAGREAAVDPGSESSGASADAPPTPAGRSTRKRSVAPSRPDADAAVGDDAESPADGPARARKRPVKKVAG